MSCLDENTVAELFDGVLSPAERARVEEHLDACARCRSLVAAIGSELSGPVRGTVPAATPRPALLITRGTVIGRYRVTDTVGVGSMGVVYAAHDPQLDRRVALKRLRADDDGDPAIERRLLDEAKSMARLSHPNVVAIHDVIQSEAGMYIAMEYVAGQTLTRWLEAKRSVPERLAVFVQAGEGLAAAHAAGMVHRDFKPDNVLVAADGRARVTDFGLASLASPPRPERSPRAERMIVGTPRYMAPEQRRGEPADPRSDQFSFCVALFEALFGHPPFRGDSMDALTRAAADGRVALPSPPASLSIPAPVRRAIIRGLAGDPDLRHPNMPALLARLRPPRRPRRARRALGLGSLVALSGLTMVGLWPDRPTACPPRDLSPLWNDSRRAAVSEALAPWPAREEWLARIDDALVDTLARWSAAHQQTCEATKVWRTQPERLMEIREGCLERRRQELESVVEALEGLSPSAGPNAIDAIHRLPPVEDCLEVESPPRPAPAGPEAATVTSLIVRARAMTHAGDFDRAEPTAVRARALAESASPQLAAEAALALALVLLHTDQTEAAEAALYDALEYADEVGADDLRVEALTLLTHTVGYAAARYERGSRYGAQAHALATHIDAPPTLRARLWRYRGRIHHDQGAFDASVEAHRRALEIITDAGLLLHPERPKTLLGLGDSQRALGRLDHAEATYREALGIVQRTVGTHHPRTANTLHGLGDVLSQQHRDLEALAAYEQAADTYERVFGTMHIDTASALCAVAHAQIRLEQLERAEASLARAQPLFDDPEYRDHPRRATALGILAHLRLVQGRGEQAIAALTTALDIRTRSTPRHPDIAVEMINLSRILIERERYESALTYATQAATLAPELLGADHEVVATALALMGQAQLALQRTDAAIANLQRAIELGDPPRPPADRLGWAMLLVRAMEDHPDHRDRALPLARRMVEPFEGPDTPSTPDLAELRAWIAAHDSGPR